MVTDILPEVIYKNMQNFLMQTDKNENIYACLIKCTLKVCLVINNKLVAYIIEETMKKNVSSVVSGWNNLNILLIKATYRTYVTLGPAD